MAKKLDDTNINNISGGRGGLGRAIQVNNIMAVEGLSCWDTPTTSDDCLQWEYNGSHISQNEAWQILNIKANRNLNNNELFLKYYIENYNLSLLKKFDT